MRRAVIVSAVRTAIGKFEGSLKEIPAARLGAIVIKEAIERAKIDPSMINEVIMGNVLQAGLGQNPARQAEIYSGVIPVSVPAFTVNKVCGSGLKAIMIAASEIRAGTSDIIVAGGMENMNLAPYLLPKARFGYRLFDGKIVDGMVFDGLWDIYNNFHMGMTGEIIAQKYGITREDADKLALWSHQKAIAAIKSGRFKDEIVPVEVPVKGGKIDFLVDEGPREDTSLEKLAKLKPVFKPDGGIVTAGNASQISDGAAAVVVMEEEKAKEMGIRPLVYIRDYNAYGLQPEFVMETPIPTVRILLERNKLTINDIDLFEHNEAFATASCAVMKALNVPRDRFNVNGGAVALGHPIGCSGARVLVTLIHEMIKRGSKRGVATLCLGGANAVAMLVERTPSESQ
jgi:acetyl-CoA C-acetyltransferase